jgi:hypothetical protein
MEDATTAFSVRHLILYPDVRRITANTRFMDVFLFQFAQGIRLDPTCLRFNPTKLMLSIRQFLAAWRSEKEWRRSNAVILTEELDDMRCEASGVDIILGLMGYAHVTNFTGIELNSTLLKRSTRHLTRVIRDIMSLERDLFARHTLNTIISRWAMLLVEGHPIDPAETVSVYSYKQLQGLFTQFTEEADRVSRLRCQSAEENRAKELLIRSYKNIIAGFLSERYVCAMYPIRRVVDGEMSNVLAGSCIRRVRLARRQSRCTSFWSCGPSLYDA